MTTGTMSFTVTGDTTNWPAGGADPFVIDIEYNDGSAEKVLIAQRVGSVFTVTPTIGRGYDGTTAASHDPNAIIRHVVDAATLDEANAHVNDETLDDHPQYLNTTRHDDPARHGLGTVVPAAAAGTSFPGDSGSEGSSTAGARADHRHEREEWGNADDIASSEPGDVAVPGSTGRVADAGHQHAREAKGLVGDIVSSEPGDAAVAGNTGRTADAGHQHAREAWGTAGDLSNSLPGHTASAGSTGKVADAGHRHAREEAPDVISNGRGITNTGDTTVDDTGVDTEVATFTFTLTQRKAVLVLGQVSIRGAVGTPANFAGFLTIKSNGAQIGNKQRYHTHDVAGALPDPVVFAATTLYAGTHTVKLYVSNDSGTGGDVWVSNVNLQLVEIGG